MNKLMIAGIAALTLGIPAVAQMAPRGDRAERMAQPVTRAELEARIKERFARNDRNRDGAITREEIRQVREERQDERQDRLFALMDADKNGQISRGEFDTARERRMEMRGKRGGEGKRHGWRQNRRGGGMMGGMFAGAPADGRITLDDVLSRSLERFDRADANRDGTLTPEERRAHREKMRAERRDRRG
jgi:EF-hand domain pair/EF hand